MRQENSKGWFWAAIILGAVVTTAFFGNDLVEYVTSPVRGGLWRLGRNGATNSQQTEDVIAQRDRLLVELGSIREENEALKKEIGAAGGVQVEMIPAEVVGGGAGLLRIDRGEGVGISEGMFVVSEGKVVGKVGFVNKWGGRVLLPNNSGFRMVAKVVGEVSLTRRALGLVEGREGKVVLTRVLIEEEIAEGDLVVSAGGEDGPEGFVIGKVSSILPSDGVYRQAEIDPGFNYFDLNWVFVVK